MYGMSTLLYCYYFRHLLLSFVEYTTSHLEDLVGLDNQISQDHLKSALHLKFGLRGSKTFLILKFILIIIPEDFKAVRISLHGFSLSRA